MRVHVERGKIRRIEPHPDNLATPEGVCLKGLSYVERVVSPDRIVHPLRRRRGAYDSFFERISWDQALDEIVSRLEPLRAAGHQRSLLYYASSGTKGLLNAVGLDFWRLYGGCTTTYGDLCWPAGLEATRLTLGDNKHSVPWDLANAGLIVLWGKNTAETNIHQMVFVEQALENGATLVVIDPRRTETAERAQLFVQPRPGTDGALALGVAHQLVQAGHVDREFIARHVHGFNQFAQSIAEFTPEHAAAIAEVPVEQIHSLAELFGSVQPATICSGFGMQRYTNSGQTMRSLIALLAITGNLGKPGAGWVYANLQSAIFDEVKDPLAFFPPPDFQSGSVRVSISTARLGREMLATSDPPLRMAWIERGNPVTQNPDTNKVLEAMRGLEFRVVVDQFLTDTAREADIILPAKTMFEQSDVIGAYWHPYIQLKQKMLEPPGQVKPESEIYWLLAERLGMEPEEVRDVIPGPSDAEVEAYLNRRLEPYPELTLERLAEGPMLPPGHQEIAFSDYKFPTPSGKIELLSAEAVERWGADPVPTFFEPRESVRNGDEAETRPEKWASGNGPQKPMGRYPLYLMTPNTKNRIHSQFNNLRMIRQFGDRPLLTVHPADADDRGIREGDRVRVHNDRGSLEINVRLDDGIKPGCVSVTNGWWISEGGTVNFCSPGEETDMGHGAAFHDNLVQIVAV
jgi:anaerobic selenocysteine-containing dehydrogenase